MPIGTHYGINASRLPACTEHLLKLARGARDHDCTLHRMVGCRDHRHHMGHYTMRTVARSLVVIIGRSKHTACCRPSVCTALASLHIVLWHASQAERAAADCARQAERSDVITSASHAEVISLPDAPCMGKLPAVPQLKASIMPDGTWHKADSRVHDGQDTRYLAAVALRATNAVVYSGQGSTASDGTTLIPAELRPKARQAPVSCTVGNGTLLPTAHVSRGARRRLAREARTISALSNEGYLPAACVARNEHGIAGLKYSRTRKYAQTTRVNNNPRRSIAGSSGYQPTIDHTVWRRPCVEETVQQEKIDYSLHASGINTRRPSVDYRTVAGKVRTLCSLSPAESMQASGHTRVSRFRYDVETMGSRTQVPADTASVSAVDHVTSLLTRKATDNE